MHVLHRMLVTVLILGLVGPLSLPGPAYAGITVEKRNLVSVQRLSRRFYLYSYSLTINNVGTALEDVKVYVSCNAPGTYPVDSIAEFGDIPENARVTSTGTFSLRRNRRATFDPGCLKYEVGFDTTVILSGTVTDEPLPNALVIGTVTRPDSGRPIFDSGRPIFDEYSTTADENGNYTLELEAITDDDFIVLEARGTGAQEGAVLTSSIGSVGALREVGSSGSIIVDSGDAGALNVTHITTAQDELVRRLNNGVLPTTDAELATLRSQVSGSELLTLAAVIKTVIDNPGVVNLPAGINNTLELIQNEQVFDDFLADITNDPVQNDLLQQATSETAQALNIGFSPAEIPGRLHAAIRDDVPFRNQAYVFDFGVNNDGTVILGNGSTDITWVLNADGEIEVTLINPPVTETFVFDPNSPTGQVRALVFTSQLRLVRLANGQVYDQVFVLPTTTTTFPDDPTRPDEVEEALPGPDLVYLAFGNDGILPITPVDVAGEQIAVYYLHQDNNSVGFGVDGDINGADFLTFNADGTGSTARRGFVFTWTANADGTLTVDFSNGDRNQYVLFSENGDVAKTILIGTLASTGVPRTLGSEAIGYDGVSDFSVPNLANRRYRSLFSILRPEDGLAVFDYLFLADGSGCRITGTDPTNVGAQRLEWESTALNRLDSRRFRPVFDPNDPTAEIVADRRGWQAIDVEPGTLGDRFWLIENADFNLTGDNTYVFTDPTVTPGRINSYEFIEDLTGQFDPCGFGTSSSLTTLFGADNGGVGNMFDVTANTPVQVTGLDVNLNFAPGTQVEVSVYTVADGWEGTVTAPATCTFNCAFDATAWGLVSTRTVTANGPNVATFVDIDDLVLDAGTRTGFWVTLARDGSIVDEMLYTNIAGPGNVSDVNIIIEVGAGVTGQAGAEGIARDRAWNGTVYYDTR